MSDPAPLDLTPTRRSAWRSLAVILALTLGLLAAGAGYGRLRYGSIAAAIEYLGGQAVLVDERAKAISGVTAGSKIMVKYTLTNNSSRPLKIIGATSSCTCTTFEELPMMLAPAESRSVPVRISISEHNPDFSGTMRLFTDEPTTPEVPLTYTVHAIVATKAGVNAGP